MFVCLRPVSLRRAVRPALATLFLLGSAACSHTKLDDSFGIRNREIFRVQNAARTPRELVNNGQVAEGAMAKYYQKMAPSDNGGGGGASSGPPNPAQSLKIPGLAH